MSNYYIYLLVDPRYNRPFYIGLSNTIKYERPLQHLNQAKNINENGLKCKIIRKIWSKNLEVGIEIYKDGLTLDKAKQLEIQLISKYGRIELRNGCLANLTAGGDYFDDKAREKISLIQKEKLQNGTHNFITNHPMNNPENRIKQAIRCSGIENPTYGGKVDMLLSFMNNTEEFIVTNDLVTHLEFSRIDVLCRSIKKWAPLTNSIIEYIPNYMGNKRGHLMKVTNNLHEVQVYG